MPAKYAAIADDLRAAIDAGTYPPGSELPSEQELAKRNAVHILTVRQALDVLVAEGRISKTSGRHATVRVYRPKIRDGIGRLGPSTWPAGLDIWSADAPDRDYRTAGLQVGRGLPTAQAAAALGGDPEEPVIIRRRTYLLDGKPILLATSYIPLAFAAGTAVESDDSGPGGIYARLADAGHAPVSFREDLQARMPTPDEARELELLPGTPVVDIVRIARQADGQPVEVNVMAADAGSHIFRYEWDVELAGAR